ncbi:MAG TPA: endonuclease MutS2 [Clostridiaceae bacterium]|nr:endonuclease MutS2 [Clostridiaceae bacterium]
MYTTFEKNFEASRIKGRPLSTLEFDKIREKLLANAKTPFGKSVCRDLFPSSDFDRVKSDLNRTDEAFQYIQSEGSISFSGISDITSSVSYALNGGVLSMQELLDVASFFRAVNRLERLAKETHLKEGVFADYFASLKSDMVAEKDISFCINTPEEMNDRASDTLYDLRRHIRTAQSHIRQLLEKIIRNHPEALQEQLVTIRNDRYVVPVKSERRSEIPGIVHDMSSSGQTIFVEPLGVVEANNKIAEWIAAEKQEIERILQRLSGIVAASFDMITKDIAWIAQIDFCCAKATLALDMRATCPILNQEGHIFLRKARHPLIDASVVVPIDFELGKRFRTLVVTGPNTGGKTVSLKTCGLLTLMAMAGLFIPCQDHSEIAVFRQVLADIGDEQSIEQSLSTFSSHMKNLVEILHLADESTLVLVDELGSGTDPSEGAALAISILDEFRKRGAVTVATTHYKELKGYAIETPDVENACCEFDTETLSPTYRLLIGMPGVSNAFVISKKLGLSQEVIDAAQSFLSKEGIRFESLLSEVERHNRESEKLKNEIRQIRDQAAQEREALRVERDNIESSKQRILAQARIEKQELLEEAFDECEAMLSEVKQRKKKTSLEESERKLQTIRNNLRAGISDLEQERVVVPVSELAGQRPDVIRIGASYYSDTLGIEGVLIKGPDSRGQCVIASGDMKLTVSAHSLRYPDKDQPKPESGKKQSRAPVKSSQSGAGKIKNEKMKSTVSELMLIGKTVDDALFELDHYIDDCVLSGMGTVRIVHGKGSGALRSAVRKQLKTDRRVASFRSGEIGEGEDGVTIVTL